MVGLPRRRGVLGRRRDDDEEEDAVPFGIAIDEALEESGRGTSGIAKPTDPPEPEATVSGEFWLSADTEGNSSELMFDAIAATNRGSRP